MWRMPNNILWRGDQSNTLTWCNHVAGCYSGVEGAADDPV